MTIKPDEARLEILKHLFDVLYYFHAEEDTMSEEELDDLRIDLADIADLIGVSLGLEVVSVDDDGVVTVTMKPTDIETFVEGLLNQTIIGEDKS